jgi:hypothetical protein
MTTTKHMRTVLAAAAAGALVLGSAGGAIAKGKPDTAPTPQTTVKLQSVSIKGHSPLDLKGLTADSTAAINLRAKVWDPKRALKGTETVEVTLGVYAKKSDKTRITGTEFSDPVQLKLAPGQTLTSKVKRFGVEPAVLTAVWDYATELVPAADLLTPGAKAYICIATADVVGVDGEKKSVMVQKRLGERKGKAVRDCVKVIDSTPAETTPAQ